MANRYDRQILGDGWRGLEVRFLGVLDTANMSVAPAVRLNELNQGDPLMRLIGLRLDCVQYSIGQGIEVQLEWNAATPQPMVALAGSHKQKFEHAGGLQPDQLNPGYDGGINLRTTGFVPGTTQNFTITCSFTKLFVR